MASVRDTSEEAYVMLYNWPAKPECEGKHVRESVGELKWL